MNLFLPARYDERIERLTLGIEPLDALRGLRIAPPLEVAIDRAPISPTRAADDIYGLTEATDGLRRPVRRNSCRYLVMASDEIASPVPLRFNDPTRRYVPRRVHYAVPASTQERRFRIRRPALFPGAAYDVDDTATGLRGRVRWSSAATAPPVRWARIEATVGGTRVGYAHGDDRGEFLLLLGSRAGGLGDLPIPLRVRVTVYAPPAMPARTADYFSDLPIERHVTAAGPDDISPGLALPAIDISGTTVNYAATADSRREVTFEVGRLRTDEPAFFMSA
jgi:hypothetical protein